MKNILAILLVLCLLPFPTAVAQEGKEPAVVASPVPGEAKPTPEEPPVVSPTPEAPAARLFLDNTNLYENMEKSYSQGYMPTVRGDEVVLVLPLLCEGELEGNCLRARVELGDAQSPFIRKNYEKTVKLAQNSVNRGKGQVTGYCVSFPLALKPRRVNGSYPVTIEIMAACNMGTILQETFTIYVTISDGKDPDATPKPEPEPTPQPSPAEPVVLPPRVLVAGCEADSLEENAVPGVINAGDRLRMKVLLKNTSKTEKLENMAVTAAASTEHFSLNSTADSFYTDSLPPGESLEVTFDYTVKPETPAGQYEIALQYEFSYHNGQAGSGSGIARVNIHQPLELEFSLPQMPQEAVISDTIEVGVQAINLSRAKAYQVRAQLEADGISPAGTAFLGDLEGGASQTVALPLTITGLTQGEFPYGLSEGKLIYFYEDETGQEYQAESSFSLMIKSPFSEKQEKEPEQPEQWWVIMGAIGLALFAFGGGFAGGALRKGKA